MKKILFFFALLFSVFSLNAAIISDNTTINEFGKFNLLNNTWDVYDSLNCPQIANDEVVTFDYVTRMITITVQSGYYFSGWVQACNGNATSAHSCIIKQFTPTSSGGTFTFKAPLRSTSTDTGVVVHTSNSGYFFPY